MTTDIRAFALDLAERAGWTFLQAFGAYFGVAQYNSPAELKTAVVAASVAGGAAVLSLLKGVLAGTRTGTASMSRKAVQAVAAAVTEAVPTLVEPVPADVEPMTVEPMTTPAPAADPTPQSPA